MIQNDLNKVIIYNSLLLLWVFSDIEFIIVGYSGTGGSDVHIYTANKNNNYDGLLDNVPDWSSSKNTNIAPQNELITQIVQSYKTFVGKDHFGIGLKLKILTIASFFENILNNMLKDNLLSNFDNHYLSITFLDPLFQV